MPCRSLMWWPPMTRQPRGDWCWPVTTTPSTNGTTLSVSPFTIGTALFTNGTTLSVSPSTMTASANGTTFWASLISFFALVGHFGWNRSVAGYQQNDKAKITNECKERLTYSSLPPPPTHTSVQSFRVTPPPPLGCVYQSESC